MSLSSSRCTSRRTSCTQRDEEYSSHSLQREDGQSSHVPTLLSPARIARRSCCCLLRLSSLGECYVSAVACCVTSLPKAVLLLFPERVHTGRRRDYMHELCEREDSREVYDMNGQLERDLRDWDSSLRQFSLLHARYRAERVPTPSRSCMS